MISIYAKHDQGYRPEYFGLWEVQDVFIKGISLKEGFYSVGKDVYYCPGPSDFLENMMEEMRRSCKIVDYAEHPLSEGIEHVGHDLLWITTYCPALTRFCQSTCRRHYERHTPLGFDLESLRPVVQVRLPNLIIEGFAQKDEEITPTPILESHQPAEGMEHESYSSDHAWVISTNGRLTQDEMVVLQNALAQQDVTELDGLSKDVSALSLERR